MTEDKENQKKFILDMLKYFEDSMKNVAGSIEKLIDIQKIYPPQYEEFKEISIRPEILLNIDLDDKTKSIIFELLLRLSTLTQGINNILNLTVIEKEELLKNLNNFIRDFTIKIKELQKK